jgi:hypothetical protein
MFGMENRFIVCGGLFSALFVALSVGTASLAEQEGNKDGQLLKFPQIVTTSIQNDISESE